MEMFSYFYEPKSSVPSSHVMTVGASATRPIDTSSWEMSYTDGASTPSYVDASPKIKLSKPLMNVTMELAIAISL